MKTFKYFLALPLALSAITACGGSSFKTISYEDAVKIVENYKESIKNSKAANISVSGHVDKIDIRGDVTWWSYTEQEEAKQQEKKVKAGGGEVKPINNNKGLISMIPNFSVKDGEIHVDDQELAKFSVPGSMVSLVDTVMSSGDNKEEMLLVFLDNLPKFPMNNKLLKLVNGFEALIDTETGEMIPWDDIKSEPWESAKVSYGSSNGRLKITLEAEDTESFVDEIRERLGIKEKKKSNEDPEPEKIKIPGTITVTTNNLGYIDSAAINFKFKDIDEETSSGERYYLHIKGDAEFQISLRFAQEISNPITIKYQLTPYHCAEDDETPTDYYYVSGSSPIGLVKETDNIIGPTTDLDQFKDYVTFDWYSNVVLVDDHESNPTQHYEITKNYDDPIFDENYWHGEDTGKNVAFTDEDYDVIVLPTYSQTEGKSCAIMGAQINSDNDELLQKSFVTTSVDGRLISTNEGIPHNSQKALLSAADVTKTINVGEEKDVELHFSDEIFINSNMLKADGSECVVNIPVIKDPQ